MCCAMQHGLYDNAKQLLGFSETLLLFELTNTFYTGRKKGALLEYGRSKEKRSNSPLVTLALTLDASGFVRSARILPGNASEPKTLQKAVEELSSARVSVIMDAGIATRANLLFLKEKGPDWICVQRSKTPPAPENTPDECWNTNSGIAIKAWRMADKDEEARYYLQSAARKSTGDSILDARRAKLKPHSRNCKRGSRSRAASRTMTRYSAGSVVRSKNISMSPTSIPLRSREKRTVRWPRR